MPRKKLDKRPAYVCTERYAIKKARRGVTLNKWELEKLAASAFYAVQYSTEVLHGRFVEAEEVISKDSTAAFKYAAFVIRDRWEMGEAAIAENEDLSLQYARDVLKSRFPLGEGKILTCIGSAVDYSKNVLRGRWRPLERKILNMSPKEIQKWWDRRDFYKHISDYLKVIGGRWFEYEEKLLRDSRALPLYKYAKHLGGRLPDALHQKMMMFSFDPKKQKHSKLYLKFLDRCEAIAFRYIDGLPEDERWRLFHKLNEKEAEAVTQP